MTGGGASRLPPARRRVRLGRAGPGLLTILALAGWAMIGVAPRATQTPSWIDRRVEVLPDANLPDVAAAARFELAEEIAALRGRSAAASLSRDLRRTMLILLAEAIELDESWTASALRLAARAESDPLRRDRLDRLLRSVSGDDPARFVPARDRIEESRFLAAYRTGRLADAGEMLARHGLDSMLEVPWLDLAIEGGGERIRRDLLTGTVPILRPEERRRLVEFDRARLSPESARFADSAWIDGWAPLPEIDANAMAGWLRAAAES